MPTSLRAVDRADQRAHQLLREIGREIHAARMAHGLSQEAVARASHLQQAEISRIERGLKTSVTMAAMSMAAVTVGLELWVRVFPAGQPVRDRAHIALFERFRKEVGSTWSWATEVPLPIPGDKRARDRVLRGAGVVIGVEGETRPTDLQELQRRVALKKRDSGVDRAILILANTAWCRQLIRMNDFESAFPVPGRLAMRALGGGRDPGGDAVVLV